MNLKPLPNPVELTKAEQQEVNLALDLADAKMELKLKSERIEKLENFILTHCACTSGKMVNGNRLSLSANEILEN